MVRVSPVVLMISVGGINQLIGSLHPVTVKDCIVDNMIVEHQKVDGDQKDSLIKTMVGLLVGSFV